jgi:outer membrane receptor for ferrienterochelin and colicin
MSKMLLKTIIIFSAFFVGIHTLTAQNKNNNITVFGYVSDSLSNEKLIGAYVYDIVSKTGTATNTFGFFSLTIPNDTAFLIFSYIGYKPFSIILTDKNNNSANYLLAKNNNLKTVTVKAFKNAPIHEQTQMSSIDIPIELIKKVPVMFGETDVLKVLQMLPGIAKGNEGTSGIYVRGGSPDQNLILLDGVPVYNVNHLFGFFSVFNGDAIKNVQLIKGGFPARYGGRLSSVIDMNMKDGNNKKLHGEGGVGIISSRLTLEGPIKNDKTTFLVAGRRTYIDLLMRPLSKLLSKGLFSVGYYFYDFNAKISHQFSNKDKLFLSGYLGNDKFGIKAGDKFTYDNVENTTSLNGSLNWGNVTTAARWNHLFSPKLFSNFTLTYTRYKFKVGQSLQNEEHNLITNTTNKTSYSSTYISGINDLGLKLDFDNNINRLHHLRFGGNIIYHTFTPGVNSSKFVLDNTSVFDSTQAASVINAIEDYLYIEDDWSISKKLKTNVGLHLSSFLVGKSFYKSVQPRLAIRYLITDLVSIKASAVRMTQYLHLLSNAGLGLPTDLWLPVTGAVKPQDAWQEAVGIAYTYHNDYEFSIEGYYKNMNNVIEYKNGASFLSGANNWESLVTAGKAWAYGSEFLVQKKYGKLTGWIGYTLAWNKRQFVDKNNNKPFYYKYDRRHDLGIVASYTFNPKWDLSANFVFASGNALTLGTDRYLTLQNNTNPFGFNSFAQYIENVESINSYRTPAYHRMDIGANRYIKTKWGSLILNFSIYNVYNRLNVFFITSATNNNGDLVLRKVSIFPIIPSFTVNFKF